MNSSETKYVFFLDTNATEDLTENKIRSFSRLPQGWYYGEGVPASEEVIETSLELYKWARELLFFEFEAFPGANGEVLLGIYKGNYVLDLIVEPDLSVTATLEKDGEEIYDDYELTVDEAKEGIRQLRKDSKWMQSDFSTQINIVTSSEGSKALHSKTQEEKTQAFPLLTANVYFTKEIQFAATSENIMKEQLGSRLSAGSSIQKPYPTVSS